MSRRTLAALLALAVLYSVYTAPDAQRLRAGDRRDAEAAIYLASRGAQ
jgi:hypothetical protein